MTRAKQGICFVHADGYSKPDALGATYGLVRIIKGKPHMDVRPARNADGSADIRSRPMWNPGWRAKVTITFDGDMFRVEDIANLLHRAGLQVGIGEGRPDSPKSCGMGWGTFRLVGSAEVKPEEKPKAEAAG
jgi:hypothetical protein